LTFNRAYIKKISSPILLLIGLLFGVVFSILYLKTEPVGFFMDFFTANSIGDFQIIWQRVK
ncbi:hypothetical protein, partial [Bacillus marinisedimentorum]|uniref:hypothetical protein n=1 Tax=Bacillus marinisedimentorum TaxID=1821260 RepID=UPI000AC1EC64